VAQLDAGFRLPDVDDEERISTVLLAKTQRCGMVIGDLIVARFAYFAPEPHLEASNLIALCSGFVARAA
jgi:hypothetical protein